MIEGLLDMLIYIFIVYAIMILVHELGHLIAVMCYGIKYKEIKWKAIGMQYPNRLNQKQKNAVLLAGVMFGILPLMLLSKYPIELQFLILAAYIWGCMKDIKKIYRSEKK